MSDIIKPGNFNASYFNNGPGRWLKRALYFFPAVLIGAFLLVAFVFPLPLKKDSKAEVVAPISKEAKGFIGKSNRLLAELLEVQDTSVSVTSVESLNLRYPAFEFVLPYPETSGSNALDVRIVDIHPEYIKSEDMKNFYYNSSLSSLLRKQRQNLMDKYFSIDFKQVKVLKKGSAKGKNVYETRVSAVYLKKDMFKVALEKDPWRGTITSAANSLFDDEDCLYLVHKDMMVPLAKVNGFRSLNMYTAVFSLEDEAFYNSQGKSLDYYHYYKSAFLKSHKHLRVDVKKTVKSKSLGWLDIAYLDDDSAHIQIIPNKEIVCRVASPGEDMLTINSSDLANSSGEKVAYNEGMRLLLYDRNGVKITEFAMVSKNPMHVLSTMRHTNEGTSRYWAGKKNADVLTRQMAKGVGRNMSNALGVDTVRLSVDPLLSLEFEQEMKQYMNTLKETGSFTHVPGEQYEMSLTIMDMATGEILASPSVTDNPAADDKYLMGMRNSSLVRRPIGSTFKPLLTLAAVISNPSLVNLTNTYSKSHVVGTDTSGKPIGDFLGRRTKAWVSGHWGNGRGMVQYLAHSDDVYPVLLTALALTGSPDSQDLASVDMLPLGGKSYFSKDGPQSVKMGASDARITDYELIKNLASLYSVYSFHETDEDQSENLSYYLWEKLYSENDYLVGMDRRFGLDEISPNATNMRYDRFDGETLRGHLAPWVLGQGDNDWSCIKMAEAWTRMLTKQPVKASFIAAKRNDGQKSESLVELIAAEKEANGSAMTEKDVASVWNKFLSDFKQAQSIPGGTLAPMYASVMALNSRVKPAAGNLLVFSKTGTPDQYLRMENMQVGGASKYYDVAHFVFSLMSESSYKSVRNGDEAKGITCVVRITRSYDEKTSDDGLWSRHARNFFSSNSERMDKLYYMTQKYY